jgi:predicted phosphoribosyltransferase
MPVAKIGAPGHEELALGAVAPGGVTVLNDEVLAALGLTEGEVEALAARAAAKVVQQLQSYRHGRPLPSLEGRSAVVVDDGLATGATMKAALLAVRQLRPRRVVLAVPVAPPAALEALAPLVDVCVCPLQPVRMRAVGSWYGDFGQTTDAEVVELLSELSG